MTRARELRVSLPQEPQSAGHARRLVTEALAHWGKDEHSTWANLVATELVTNAILHARTTIDLVLTLDACLRLEVHDHDPRPAVLLEGSPLSSAGRGLKLVAAASNRWGSTPTPRGKTVWAEVDDAWDPEG